MPPETEVTPNEPVKNPPPIVVPVIATGPTGPGTSTPATGTVVSTPGVRQPDFVVSVISPLIALAIRFGYDYVTFLAGALTGGGATGIIPFTDFLDLLQKTALLALVPASIGLIKNLVTVFSKLEDKYPLLTGNV